MADIIKKAKMNPMQTNQITTKAMETNVGRPEKPNILFIMADQMVPFLTGTYGHKVVKTPSLDRLAARGIRFDAAYSPCPLCAPARAALMTGRYVSDTGCYDNATPIRCDEPTFAHYLTNEGYDTVLSGKMHFVGPDQLHGFAARLTTDIYPSDFSWTPVIEDRDKVKFNRGGHARNYCLPDVGVRPWSIQYNYDEETHFRALEYLYNGKHHNPFFLCVSYAHPHEPFYPTQEFWDLYEGENIEIPEYPENLEDTYSAMDRWLNAVHGTDRFDLKNPKSLYALRRCYYALVTYVDRKVGELLKALENKGLADNAVIIFTSDHGDMLCEKGMVQKRCFYEWSARVPMIITYPNGRMAGKKIGRPVSLIDLYPTFLDLGGVEEKNRLPCDGVSMVRIAEESVDAAGAEPKQERPVYSEFHTQGVLEPCFMVRKGRYKYIYIHHEKPQLFDLEKDPGEWNNLAGKPGHETIEEELQGLILGKFDPEKIKRDTASSSKKRQIIKKAMAIANINWDYEPRIDVTQMFTRR